jgi:hypothetical protein
VLNRFVTTLAVVAFPRGRRRLRSTAAPASAEGREVAHRRRGPAPVEGRESPTPTAASIPRAGDDKNFFLAAGSSGADEVVSGEMYCWERYDGENADERAVFVTDRAIYRPGQSVHFKAILLRVDPARDRYDVLPGRKVTVRFSDPNGQLVEERAFTSNDFGSVAGVFTAPAGRATGASIGCERPSAGRGSRGGIQTPEIPVEMTSRRGRAA